MPCSPPGDLPNPGIGPRSPALQADSLPAEPQGKPKNTGVSSLSLHQWIFLTQGSNWGLLHCRWILYQLSYQGSKRDPKRFGKKNFCFFLYVCKLKLIAGNIPEKRKAELARIRRETSQAGMSPEIWESQEEQEPEPTFTALAGGGIALIGTSVVLLIGGTQAPRLPALKHPHNQAWHRNAKTACLAIL